ncbi:ATP-binding protein [Caloranaerobacter sp. DY30410]|uniref:ATP-binding protein n=1 Tax=Caloranaerobacter sp. DY30410 TaxID=3238305 RepID=UPI003D02CA9C
MKLIINKTISSDLYKAKNILDEIINKVNMAICDEDIIFEVKLILNELVANSIIHGNKQDECKIVNVYIKIQNELIRIEVTDEGKGIDYDIDEYDPMDLKIGGRGLVIVNGLSDEFYIEKNKVISIKYLKRKSKYIM